MCEPSSDEWQTPKASEFDSMESIESCAKRLAYDDASPVELTIRLNGLTVSDTEATSRCGANGIGAGDGNDSGVDAGMVRHSSMNPGQLQRASSTNSAGYASSGGQDAQFASCNSSLLSICSDSNDTKLPVNGNVAANGSSSGTSKPMDLTSEGGSESSSLSGDKQRTPISVKKRVSLIESSPAKSFRSPAETRSPRARNTSINRTASCRGAPTLQTTERARSRDNKQTHSSRIVSPTRRVKAQTPNGKEGSVPPADRLRRASSVTRRSTPNSTPSVEDGRWPSTATRSTSKVRTTPGTETLVVKTKCGPLLLDNGRPMADRFMSLPRRKRATSDEDLTDKRSSRSSSTTRDRMTSSTIVRRASAREPATRPHVLPRNLKLKTMIYHEAGMQTVLTCRDIDDAFAGVAQNIPVEQAATRHTASQVDMRDKQIERYEQRIDAMNAELQRMKQTLQERSQVMAAMEQQMTRQRDDKVAMEHELQSNTKRVLAMLDLVHGATNESSADTSTTGGGDSLLMLESQIQLSGHILEEKECQINMLRKFCTELQTEMNRSQKVQQTLLDERKCFERETTELQDFLQDEKAAIVEALRDAESEVEANQEKMKEKDANIERLQDECRHLIRISEQRRQEYLGMQSKYSALEAKNCDLAVQRSADVSGATVALTDLNSRLNDLVEQLISSYNISEDELEEAVYHNEAYRNSDDSSPDSDTGRTSATVTATNGNASPTRNRSLITAIINAIRDAAHTAKAKVNQRFDALPNGLRSDAHDMLDSETEPCLMMEQVLDDAIGSDPASNEPMTTASMDTLSEADRTDDSLHNLCEAIANRRKIEEQSWSHGTFENGGNENSMKCDGHQQQQRPQQQQQRYSTQSFVDQVIDVDNMVTRLLKVLRIIQMDNDTCIQQLINEKNTLQVKKDDLSDKIKDCEHVNEELKANLDTATKQLINNCNDLEYSQTELKKSRREIDKLNEDICNLSTLCSTVDNQKNGDASDDDTDEDEDEDDQLISLENGNGHSMDTGDEASAHDETISKAIETLNGIESIVKQYPALAHLKRDLELMLPADEFNGNGYRATMEMAIESEK